MAPTPSKSSQGQGSQLKTPQSKNRLHFNGPKNTHPSPNPNSAVKETPATEHPVEVVGRIRNFPDRKDKPSSVLQVNPDRKSLRLRADIGYRDFSLDGVSLSEEEDLDGFYKKFVQSRISGVKLGAKCTIMMYGPTGSGKSHTMFGCPKQPGIVYKSLKDILGEGEDGSFNQHTIRVGTFVQVTVLEIYNEEIYDLLSTNTGGGLGFNWSKGNASKVKLEVMGKKAKNATFISGNEAGKISKEIQKVEKRRIIKSTLCNDRSSRSHCMIILDVPTVGGRLMLVDMAGSENIEQAGQIGFEAKMQTAKINQGNIALKRVVESIANGDSHVPFRDSKLTMLLQDSFEDDKSKILMILCASPDPKEIHKTISTLEYGAKAKCIIRGPHTPIKDKVGSEDSSSAIILGSRIAAMDQFIYKLQMEKQLREKERNEAHKELLKKEEEVKALRNKLEVMEMKVVSGAASEDEINMKVNERTLLLKLELEKKVEEYQRMTNMNAEMEKRRMEERILQQQEELEMLRRRLQEIESELCRTRNGNSGENVSRHMDGNGFAKKLMGIYADEDPGMVKSMELDMGDQEPFVRDVKGIHLTDNSEVVDHDLFVPRYGDKVCLSTVFEEEEEDGLKNNMEDEEVEEKEIIEEKRICSSNFNTGSQASFPQNVEPTLILSSTNPEKEEYSRDRLEVNCVGSGLINESDGKDTASSRLLRIQNIFTLCGNYRELSKHITTPPVPAEKKSETIYPRSSPLKAVGEDSTVEIFSNNALKENSNPHESSGSLIEVNGDSAGAPVPKEKGTKCLSHIPFSSLENRLPLTPLKEQSDGLAPKVAHNLSPATYINTLQI